MSVKIVKSNKNQSSILKLVKNPSDLIPSTPSDNPIFQAASDYKEKGWHVLPLNDKNYPSLTTEQQEAYKTPIPQDFNQGVGVNLGLSGMVGIDIDCNEVVPFLEAFLPSTAMHHRGDHRPVTWMFYRLLNSSSHTNISFCGFDGKELGAIKFNATTPLSPTLHCKSGKPLEWVVGHGLDTLSGINPEN